LRTAEYFAERKNHTDWSAFDRIMNRKGGEPPQPGDEVRENYRKHPTKNLSVNNVSAVFGFASTQGDECSSDVVESKAITD